jgi:hypothetical protein
VYEGGKIYADLESKYIAREHCTEGSDPRTDASTFKSRGSDICFDVSRLTRVPPEALTERLVALAAHEHIHHFNYDELEAKVVQDFFLEDGRWLVQDNIVAQLANQFAWQLYLNTSRILENLKDHKSDLGICKAIGEVGSEGGKIASLLGESRHSVEKFDSDLDLFKRSEFLSDSTAVLSGFCEQENERANLMSGYVSYRDRNQLESKLSEILQMANQFGWSLENKTQYKWPNSKPKGEIK